ncbi:putative toxin-antitoxin system toxin component, PIN family [Salisaeta longa]|uniref:putative toxin-antitoxin system toxin component, PIN family n=1 Tax=Salisaeta longa TaxID=503170 RepID=UPI000A0275C6
MEASRDPDDDKFLELALAGGAEVIISGDNNLLVLDPFRGVRIARPRAFVEAFPPLENEAR